LPLARTKRASALQKTEGAGLLAAAAPLHPAAQHPCHCRRQTAKAKKGCAGLKISFCDAETGADILNRNKTCIELVPPSSLFLACGNFFLLNDGKILLPKLKSTYPHQHAYNKRLDFLFFKKVFNFRRPFAKGHLSKSTHPLSLQYRTSLKRLIAESAPRY
jgi:hypothetical protein